MTSRGFGVTEFTALGTRGSEFASHSNLECQNDLRRVESRTHVSLCSVSVRPDLNNLSSAYNFLGDPDVNFIMPIYRSLPTKVGSLEQAEKLLLPLAAASIAGHSKRLPLWPADRPREMEGQTHTFLGGMSSPCKISSPAANDIQHHSILRHGVVPRCVANSAPCVCWT